MDLVLHILGVATIFGVVLAAISIGVVSVLAEAAAVSFAAGNQAAERTSVVEAAILCRQPAVEDV